jgi:mono/diheme cytochrome c family protein
LPPARQLFAQEPDDSLLSKGQRLAEANCAICHAIYATGNSPLVIAPTFRDIAVNYDFADLEDAFNEGVATEHPAMPDWQMTPEQAERNCGLHHESGPRRQAEDRS